MGDNSISTEIRCCIEKFDNEHELIIKQWIENNLGYISKQTETVYSIDDFIQKICSVKNLEIELKRTQNALNDACDKLAKIVDLYGCCDDDFCNLKRCTGECENDCNKAEKWKEWCMRYDN